MNPELEIELIEQFVRKDKCDRLKTFAAKPKTRDKMIREFNTPGIFNPLLITEIIGFDRTVERLLKKYRKYGMGDFVYVVSENYEWDGQEMAVEEILEQSMAMCTDVLGYCPKSKIAFYEWHHSAQATSFLPKTRGDHVIHEVAVDCQFSLCEFGRPAVPSVLTY